MENTFYPTNDYRSYLAHHGVKGMRWGHRKQISRKSRIIRGAIGGALGGAAIGGVSGSRHNPNNILPKNSRYIGHLGAYRAATISSRAGLGALLGAAGGATLAAVRTSQTAAKGRRILDTALIPTQTQMDADNRRRDRRNPGTRY